MNGWFNSFICEKKKKTFISMRSNTSEHGTSMLHLYKLQNINPPVLFRLQSHPILKKQKSFFFLSITSCFNGNGKKIKLVKYKSKMMIHIYVATQSYFQFSQMTSSNARRFHKHEQYSGF